jgi:hypothetical protein
MTFEERYSENPDFWYCLHDMQNISKVLQTRGNDADLETSIHLYGGLWAIAWIANVDIHESPTALSKLWANTLEGATRLPALIPPMKPSSAS